MDELEINFTPEILEDISKDKIYKTTIDFILNYEEDVLTLSEMDRMKQLFLEDEFYYYAEAISRAIKSIKIIFE